MRTSGGTTLSGATVQIIGGPIGFTNSSGVYTISGVTPGTYTVVATLPTGFSQIQNNVSITAGTTTTLNFILGG